ncbi:MAG: Hsp20/alpha crystallin family protein [Candidatus Woesearchaeota archaeon]
MVYNTIWDEMRQLQREMDSLFGAAMGGEHTDRKKLPHHANPSRAVDTYRRPVCDIEETDKEVIAYVELPGVDKKDIQINVVDDGFEVKVEKKKEEHNKDTHAKYYQRFYQYFSVPRADMDNARAEYKNGVLEIHAPKQERKGKLIEVK